MATESKQTKQKGMDLLIRTVNKLQDAFTILGTGNMMLPQIAVVGGQSSGKSSVLENIVGRDFLPRGSGIVTRRPLVLQLVHSPDVTREYGVFLHRRDEKYYDFDAIRTEIEADTDRETGANKGISDRPINLKIYSPNVLNLTLVDLPGITRVPVGDQPTNIEELIRSMVMRYIRAPNCIILAVTAANTDLANSDAVQCAKSVDPEGNRTLGVLTKLDLMDKGTDAMEILTGRLLPMKLGYVPVVNRAQIDIDSKKDIRQQWEDEVNFFATHSSYCTIASRCGTRFLAKRLNELLLRHIRDCLPEIHNSITMFVEEKRNELKKMKDTCETPEEKQMLILGEFVAFNNEFKNALDGHSELVNRSDELRGGARIQHIFKNVFGKKLADMKILEHISIQEIRTVIANCIGVSGGLFVPDKSFEVIIKRAIKKLDEPSHLCVQLVYDELMNLVRDIDTPNLQRFPRLREKMVEASGVLFHRLLEPTHDLISTLVQMELVRINTNHPWFIGANQKVGKVVGAVKSDFVERRRAVAEETGDDAVSRGEADHPNLHQVIKEGWMYKKGRFGKWHKRWCILQERRLRWAHQSDGLDAREVNMDGCLTQSTEKNERAGVYVFAVTTPNGETHSWKIENITDGEQWVQGLTIAANEETWKDWLLPKVDAPEEKPEDPELKVDEKIVNPDQEGLYTEKEQIETEVIRRLLCSMFDIVRTHLADCVPKAITLKMLSEATGTMHTHLVGKLFKDGMISDMLEESEESALSRNDCKEVIALMEDAIECINEVQRSKIQITMLEESK